MTARLHDGPDQGTRRMSNVERLDANNLLDTPVTVLGDELDRFLAAVNAEADAQGIHGRARADLIDMLTPQPEHVVAT